MARFYPSGGTGGADVSVVTAMADDVAKGKVIVGPDGEPITGELELTGTAADSQVLAGQTYYNTDLHEKRTGAMANQGAWKSEGLAAGAEVAIPPGYHNGGGKVIAKDLASQTPGDATAAQIWTGRKAWVNGQQVMGTLATQGGSTTIPGTAAKTIVTPNKIVTGNIVVAGDPNLIPANVKKGVPIFGVMGIAEGYFPTATDLYLRGKNVKNFEGNGINGKVRLDSGQITFYKDSGSSYGFSGAISSDMVNLQGFTKVNYEVSVLIPTGVPALIMGIYREKKVDYNFNDYLALAKTRADGLTGANRVISIDVSQLHVMGSVVLFASFGTGAQEAKMAVHRIWLS